MEDHLDNHICEPVKPLTIISTDTLKMTFNNCICHKKGQIKNTDLLGLVYSGDIAQPKLHLIENPVLPKTHNDHLLRIKSNTGRLHRLLS